jgi:5-amino-6-(5-phosphoribosylamino)uracil reductase
LFFGRNIPYPIYLENSLLQKSKQRECAMLIDRPHTTVVLAMSADGKIADVQRSHPRFGSAEDYAHLERQVAAADAVLFGATTLKAGGTAMRVLNPELLAARVRAGRPEQPIQIVCSRSGSLDPTLKFFQQPIPRYLLTTAQGALSWRGTNHFDQILTGKLKEPSQSNQDIDWFSALQQLTPLGVQNIAVLGGGEIVAALLSADCIDELSLTLCPVLLGGSSAPTPVEGNGFPQDLAPRLCLLNVQQVGQELFLHYRVQR